MASKPGEQTTSRLDLSHLRRDSRTALELAIIELAPTELLEPLAVVTGLMEALEELPPDSDSAIALGLSTAARARDALKAWNDWAASRKKLA